MNFAVWRAIAVKEGQHRSLVSVVRQRATIHALALYFAMN
jgi:hypothetical protein